MKFMLDRKVEDYSVDGKSVAEILSAMERSGGFSAKNFGAAVQIIKDMKNDKCLKFLSFPACVIATGFRGVIVEMIKKDMVDVIITTCGTLDHDLARAWGGDYYHGSYELDDTKLHQQGINRLGNILVPNNSYGEPLEKNMNAILKKLSDQKETWGGRELLREFGLAVNDESSILYWAAKKNIPVFVPGITDGAFGTNLLWFAQDNKFSLDLLRDEKELSDLTFKERKTGALILGGGISKHHTIWWNQFSGGLDYAVGITTAFERDGSLSGARIREAVSWGKVAEKARKVTVDGDITILLPLIMAAVYKN